jgi:uncharacterized membrane protein YfcA
VLDAVLLGLAGVAAGLIGSTAGLASLVSYPALLATGLSPLSANVTNTVALVSSSIGSVGASAPELHGRRHEVGLLACVAAFGGALGCVLLLTAPASAFERAVPWLIGGASLAVLVRPRLPRSGARSSRLALVPVFLIGVYGGYFGAAAGVLMLALLAHRFGELPVANAVKNLVVGTANAVAAAIFAVIAPVHWVSVVFLAAGMFVGSSVGPGVVRRTDPRLLRALIATAGLALAVVLGVRG